MATFITRIDSQGDGSRLAVKDLIDVEGLPTTAACWAVADVASPAERDAACMVGTRAAEREGRVRLVGKANLHELALGASGVNPAFGTPVNPLDSRLIPGGSSSGCAVAVASGEAELAFGTDTGGSVRLPSACCGTVGLKTTHGRIPLDGVHPLSSRFDTVGPMAGDVAGLEQAMELLDPGFSSSSIRPATVGRFRPSGVDPEIDTAIDRALAAAELDVVEIQLPGWDAALAAGGPALLADAWRNLRHLLVRRERIGADTAARIDLGGELASGGQGEATRAVEAWTREVSEVLGRVEVVALPTLATFPPTVEGVDDAGMARLTLPANVAGIPALALPVPAGAGTRTPIPASLQLLGPRGSEELLVSSGYVIEEAVSG